MKTKICIMITVAFAALCIAEPSSTTARDAEEMQLAQSSDGTRSDTLGKRDAKSDSKRYVYFIDEDGDGIDDNVQKSLRFDEEKKPNTKNTEELSRDMALPKAKTESVSEKIAAPSAAKVQNCTVDEKKSDTTKKIAKESTSSKDDAEQKTSQKRTKRGLSK